MVKTWQPTPQYGQSYSQQPVVVPQTPAPILVREQVPSTYGTEQPIRMLKRVFQPEIIKTVDIQPASSAYRR